MEKENILIASIGYCAERNGDVIHRHELAEYLNNISKEKLTSNSNIVIQIFGDIINISSQPENENPFGRLKTDAYYHLIEFDAMHSANKVALKALKKATWAIWIAVAAIGVDIIINLINVFMP